MNEMKNLIILLILLTGSCVSGYAQPAEGPLKAQGNYFITPAGKARLMVGSHTWQNFQDIGYAGAKPFDWQGYLDFMKQHHHNFMRLWVWEHPERQAWTEETVYNSPMPYLRTGKELAADGKPKFDLDQFNQAYFDRLRQRVTEAGERGIYVSVMLFQGWSLNKTGSPNGNPFYAHPLNARNNIQQLGAAETNQDEDDPALKTLHGMGNLQVLRYQEAYVRKVIETVNDLDNVLYEIINEGGATAWQYHMIDFIHQTESMMPKKHPVGMTHRISPVMYNEHLWNSPADWISPALEPQAWLIPESEFIENYMNDPPANQGKKVVITDTDHLWGHGGNYKWAWKSFTRGLNPIFMDPYNSLAGKLNPEKVPWMFIKGGICKDTYNYPDWEPLRENLGYIRDLANRLDLVSMKPMNELSSTAYCLANPGEEYVFYFPEGGTATIDLRADSALYDVEWFIPILDSTLKGTEPVQGGDYMVITAPFTGDAVLYLKRK
jgi:hypothetical protein